jgi:hypothetical protein
VVMESFHDGFARHPRGEGGDGGEDGLFRHHQLQFRILRQSFDGMGENIALGSSDDGDASLYGTDDGRLHPLILTHYGR